MFQNAAALFGGHQLGTVEDVVVIVIRIGNPHPVKQPDKALPDSLQVSHRGDLPPEFIRRGQARHAELVGAQVPARVLRRGGRILPAPRPHGKQQKKRHEKGKQFFTHNTSQYPYV